MTEIIASVHNGTFFKPKKEKSSFETFATKWLSDYAKPRVKEKTYTTYAGYVRNHLNPFIKDYDIAKITQEDLESLLAKHLESIAPATINKVLTMLKTLFKYARRWKYRDDNPAWDIDKFKEPHREMDYLQPDEIRLLIENSREPFKTLFLTAIFTGMRKSELLALQWGDIDWHNMTLHVRRSLRFKRKKDVKAESKRWWFDSPKSKRSKRAIIMSPRLKKVLEQHKFNETIRLAQLDKKGESINPDQLVFTNKEGNPLDPDNLVKREFNPSLEAAGLRMIRFHDLRHTFASLLIDQGENLKFIQSQLGHASIQTTIDRYGHLLPLKNYSDVGRRLDDKIFSEGKSASKNESVKR